MSDQNPEEMYSLIAADLGLTPDPARIAMAAATFAVQRDELVRLRAIPMPYLNGIEPLSANEWIENGGAAE